MAAARPLVTVYTIEGKSTNEQIKTPSVLLAPIRTDVVQFVHTSMAKNDRQAYGVKEGAGHQHSAESWGTGRAVARIPRVSGGGTSRSGQGAFGNMCRKGRMFAPTKVWRKWHRKINQNQRRYAVASALAASALPSLVMARGHRIESIPEVPLVVDGAEKITKTKQAVSVLTALGAYADVEKAKESRKIRAGVGKMRNRRHVQRRGPLVVYSEDNGITQAFRNLPGVELCHVDRLNLLQLAPGGHVGRLILWTKSAIKRLDEVWGSLTRESVQKKGYTLPHPMMVQSDLGRLINSDEIQSKVRPAKKGSQRAPLKKNPLTNLGAMVKLNPYTLSLRRSELLAQERQKKHKQEALEAKRKKLKVKLAPEEKAKMEADKKHDRMQITKVGKDGKKTTEVVKAQKQNYLAIVKDAEVKVVDKKVFRTELPRDPSIKVGRVKVVRVKKAPKGGAKGEKKEGDDAKADDKNDAKKDDKAAAKKK